jgi:hypothetical protein
VQNSVSQVDPFSKPIAPPTANIQQSPIQNGVLSDALLDIYFVRLHGKPFCILDEATTRQHHQLNQLPAFLAMAISAIASR